MSSFYYYNVSLEYDEFVLYWGFTLYDFKSIYLLESKYRDKLRNDDILIHKNETGHTYCVTYCVPIELPEPYKFFSIVMLDSLCEFKKEQEKNILFIDEMATSLDIKPEWSTGMWTGQRTFNSDQYTSIFKYFDESSSASSSS